MLRSSESHGVQNICGEPEPENSEEEIWLLYYTNFVYQLLSWTYSYGCILARTWYIRTPGCIKVHASLFQFDDERVCAAPCLCSCLFLKILQLRGSKLDFQENPEIIQREFLSHENHMMLKRTVRCEMLFALAIKAAVFTSYNTTHHARLLVVYPPNYWTFSYDPSRMDIDFSIWILNCWSCPEMMLTITKMCENSRPCFFFWKQPSECCCPRIMRMTFLAAGKW